MYYCDRHVNSAACSKLDELTGLTILNLLTVSDHRSQFIAAYPVKDMTAQTAVQALIRGWFSTCMIPKCISPDAEVQFTANLFKQMTERYKVDHSLSASQNHRRAPRT